MFAVPVTVSVLLLILQLVPEVPVWPEEEIVKFCAENLKQPAPNKTNTSTRMNFNMKNEFWEQKSS
jgi:hypothetical protein